MMALLIEVGNPEAGVGVFGVSSWGEEVGEIGPSNVKGPARRYMP